MTRTLCKHDGTRANAAHAIQPTAGRGKVQLQVSAYFMAGLLAAAAGCGDDRGTGLSGGEQVGAVELASGAVQTPIEPQPDATPSALSDAGRDAGADATQAAPPIPPEADAEVDTGRVGEVCLNGVDDDEDLLVDCEDDECRDLPACVAPEVWVLYAVPVGGRYNWELFGSSTRLPDQPVRLSGPAAPLRGSLYTFAFDWQRDTLFVARATPEAYDLFATSSTGMVPLRSGLSAVVTGASFDVAADGAALWVGRTMDASVLERIDLATPNASGGILLDPVGSATTNPVAGADSSRVFAVRLLRPPTPDINGGDPGETEVVSINTSTLEFEPVAPGNVGRLTVRRETGQLYGVDWGRGVVLLDEEAEQWVRVPDVPDDAVPVGEDLWVHPADGAMHVFSASLGTISDLPLPEAASGEVQRFIAVVAPEAGTLHAFAFE